MRAAPLVMIGWDAADWSRVRALTAAGELPALASLLRDGAHGALESVAEEYAGGVWPTFYTGKAPAWHGIYHSKLWRQERMRCETASESWLPERPFWERWDTANGPRVCAVDVPMLLGRPRPVNGLQLAGFGTHDLIARGSAPPALWRELRREFGAPVLEPERFGPQTARALLALRRNLLRATEQMSGLCRSLLRRERWDLFLAVFGAPHRAGHYLWDLSQIEESGLDRASRAALEGALADVYRACDTALARVLDAAPADARVLVFAVHGMQKNRGWSDLCPALLDRIARGSEGEAPKRGWLFALKQRLPTRLAEDLVSLLPLRLRQELVAVWSARMFDWRRTELFPLPMDQAGYLRINLRGREPQGIVETGPDYHALCLRLREALESFRDLESGEPIVADVRRAYGEAEPAAPYRDRLPDLVVSWSERSATEALGVRSERFGELRLPARGRLPSGRSGNHRNLGWCIAAGAGLPAGAELRGHVLDLAPSVHEWIGLARPADLQGHALTPGAPPAGAHRQE